MKKLLRAAATSNASSGEGNEERAPSRILKQVFGSFRSSPSRQRSSSLAASARDGQEGVLKEGASHRIIQRQHANTMEVQTSVPGVVQPVTRSSTALAISAPSQLVLNEAVGNADLHAEEDVEPGLANTDEEQKQEDFSPAVNHPPYEPWDRYLSPTGHSLSYMSEPAVETMDFSTEMLFQANVASSFRRPEPDCSTEQVQEQAERSADYPEQNNASAVGRHNDSGITPSESTSQSRKSTGAVSTASQSIVSAAHAALLATNLARQPGVNLSIDYGTEIYLTDSSPIGQGQFGSVYRGVYGGKSVAIKLLPKMFLGDASPADVETFIQEAAVLSGVEHPNVVKFYGGSLSPPYVFIVEELMDRSLADVLYHQPHEPFPLRRVLSVGMDVARGLYYLHRCNPAIVHRDLKPENILLEANGTAKISDFGLARCKYQSYVKTNRREAGSLAYMAPECFDARMGKLTDRLDVFSFGVLLWVMLTREFPWEGMRTHDFLQRMVIGGGRLAVPQDDNVCPLALRRLLSACWADLPSERPSCQEIMVELERMLKYMPTDS